MNLKSSLLKSEEKFPYMHSHQGMAVRDNNLLMNLVLVGKNNQSILSSRRIFETHGVSITLEEDLNALQRLLGSNPFDGLIVDCAHTGLNPLDTVQFLRHLSSLPLIVIVSDQDEMSRVLVLELGADDCIHVKTSPRELLARVRAVMRRIVATTSMVLVREAGGIRLHRGNFKVEVGGRECRLTTAEFRILERLMLAEGKVVSREALAAYGLGRQLQVEDRSVDVHISRLRRKLASFDDGKQRIRSLRGHGYMLLEKT